MPQKVLPDHNLIEGTFLRVKRTQWENIVRIK